MSCFVVDGVVFLCSGGRLPLLSLGLSSFVVVGGVVLCCSWSRRPLLFLGLSSFVVVGSLETFQTGVA